MRDAINNNPVAQAAVIGFLVIAAAFFFVSSSGGGEEEAEAPAGETATLNVEESEAAAGGLEATAGATSLDAALSEVSAADTETPPLPAEVNAAWKANRTLVLLFVHGDGIDDRAVKSAAGGVDGFRDAELFVVPAAKISRYAAITEGVGVDRTPALVVVTPKDLKKSVPVASVHYGYQSPASVSQAVIDAGYEGPTVDYHP